MKVTFPKLVAVGVPPLVSQPLLDAAQQQAASIPAATYSGVVSKEGTWLHSPNANWHCQRLAEGLYRVHHGIGSLKYSLHPSLLVQPGSFAVLDLGFTSFDLETTLHRTPTDIGFSFTLTQVAS